MENQVVGEGNAVGPLIGLILPPPGIIAEIVEGEENGDAEDEEGLEERLAAADVGAELAEIDLPPPAPRIMEGQPRPFPLNLNCVALSTKRILV